MADRIVELQRELAANPSSRQFYQLGELLRRDGRAAEAAEVLAAGLASHSRYVAAWVALGRARIEIGQAAPAVEALKQALDLDVSNPVAWRLLGEARLMEGQRLAALDAMQRALDLVPGDDMLQAAVEALASETAPPVGPPRPLTEPPPPAVERRAVVSEPPPVLEAELPPVVSPEPEPAVAAPVVEVAAPPEPEPLPVVPEPTLAPEPLAVAPEPAVAEPPPAPFALEAPPAPPSADPFEFTDHGLGGAAAFDDVFGLDQPPAGFETPFAPTLAEAPVPEAVAVAVPETTEAVEPAFAAPIEAEQPSGATYEIEAFTAPAVVPETGAGGAFAEAPLSEPVPPAAEGAFAKAVPPAAEEPVETWTEPEPGPPPALEALPPATLTMARLFIQQQQLPEAVKVLERLRVEDPDNQEAADLLELVRDMLEPLPEPLPPLSVRERKIAALQRLLACLTLGRDRAQA